MRTGGTTNNERALAQSGQALHLMRGFFLQLRLSINLVKFLALIWHQLKLGVKFISSVWSVSTLNRMKITLVKIL